MLLSQEIINYNNKLYTLNKYMKSKRIILYIYKNNIYFN